MATLVLVRHCKAADRERWEGSDRDRPLIERGRTQAERLARYLAPSDPALVASSPWLRCVQTADPVAAAAGLEVTSDARLGYDAPDLRDWVIESLAVHPGRDLVAISHGDLIPQFLSDAGLLRGFGRFRTGSLYRVHVDGDRLRPPATYVDRADLRASG
jgi:broad specificity phosphatase PhoE